MRCNPIILGLAILAAGGCASHLKTARQYAAHGKHEMAVYYLGGHYRTHHGPEAKAELVRGTENAIRSIEATYQDRAQQSLTAAALGAATRLEGLLDYARVQGLDEFSAHDDGRLVREALPKAAKKAVQAVDKAEADGRPAKEQTALLRKALALDPHNPELSERYDRTRSGLKLNLAMKVDCRISRPKACRQFINRLTARLSEERREFTELVEQTAGNKNSELTATVDVQQGDSQWQRVGKGKVEAQVEVRNKYKEVEKDAEGNPVTKPVRAAYQLFERTTQAKVTVVVRIRDLRPPGRLLFEDGRQLTETDRRQYVTWNGDYRALGTLLQVGTDRTPPNDPDQLTRKAVNRLADVLAKQALIKLEGAGQ